MSSGPDLPHLPPRPRPSYGSNKPSSPVTSKAAPPIPAPRGGNVSALAKSFQGAGGGTYNANRPPSPPSRNVTPTQQPAKPSTPVTPGLPPQPAPEPLSPAPLPPSSSRPSRKTVNDSGKSMSVQSTSSTEGFGACLQNCYETIGKRHEDELVALETLRGHVFSRARLDKEYSEGLAKMNMKASRKMNTLGNKSSAILQV